MSALFVLNAGVIACASAHAAPCALTWSEALNGKGLGDGVFALAPFDFDDAGPLIPQLVAGGQFQSAGASGALRIARWNGAVWSPIGDGFTGTVSALASYDADGAGAGPPELYAAGDFAASGITPLSRIARWNGSAWAPLLGGLNGPVQALASFDPDGGGPGGSMLIAGGSFAQADGVSRPRIAQWSGSAWSGLSTGMNGAVSELFVFDQDGAGPGTPVLVAGGSFTTAGTHPALRIARWDGADWAAYGVGPNAGMNAGVNALAAFDDDGPGPNPLRLYAGGVFTFAGGQPIAYVAKWNGSAWEDVGGGTNGAVLSLHAFDPDGPGPKGECLLAAGLFSLAGGTPASRVAMWNGLAWSPVDDGLLGGPSGPEGWAITSFDDDGPGGSEAAAFLGGFFDQAGAISCANIGRLTCVSGPGACPGDADGNATVEFADVTSVLTNFGASYLPTPGTGPGDADGNGTVEFADVTAVLTNFGATCR